MGTVAWQDAEIERIREGIKLGESNAEIAATLIHRSRKAVENKRHELGFPPEGRTRMMAGGLVLTREASTGPEHVVLASPESDEEPIDDLLDRAIRQTKRAVARAKSLPYALAKIVTSKPIAISFISDQHIQLAGATDMERMFEDADLVALTPGVYCILGGDGVDNHIKHRRAMLNGASKPADEWRIYNEYLRRLGYKTLGMVSGNHDDWSLEMAGIDMVSHLAKLQKVHYAPDEMVMTVRLQATADAETGQDYTIKMRHKYRYNSSLNLLHSVKRMYDLGEDPFDVGVVGHHHEAAFEIFSRHGLSRYAFRPGSYQITSDYSRSGGFNRATPTCPTVILWPGERRIHPVADLREGVDFLAALRG